MYDYVSNFYGLYLYANVSVCSIQVSYFVQN